MADDIKPGSVVQLNSGSPKMTVTDVKPINGVVKAWCSWFDGPREDKGVFPVASLKRLE
jgi:uncharacterized protein YodC (DUF2158 family)